MSSSDANLGLGINVRQNLAQEIGVMTTALKELNTSVQSLTQVFSAFASSANKVSEAHQKHAISTKAATEAAKEAAKASQEDAVAKQREADSLKTADQLWDEMVGATTRDTEAIKKNTAAGEEALVVRKALSKATADDRGWMGMQPKVDPNTENAQWLRYFETILKGTGSATIALRELQRAQSEMSAPKAERDIFIGTQLDALKQLNGEQVSANQIRRVLTGTTVEQIKAESQLNEVNIQTVTALTNQWKLLGDVGTARAFLNEIIEKSILTDTQKTQLQNLSIKLEQDEQKLATQRVASEVQSAELTAKNAVAKGNLGLAIQKLTEAQNINNLSEEQRIKLATQIEQLNVKQAAQTAQLNTEEIRRIQTQAQGEMAAKRYAEAIVLLQAAQSKATQGTVLYEQVTNQLANAQRKLEATAKGAAQGIHSQWSQSFLFFGIAMGVNSAVQQLAAATGEKANPALMQFGRIMQEVSSGAMVGMMSGLGTTGMLVGALGGGLLGLGLSLATVDPQIQALNQSLASAAKKDDAIDALAKLANVTTQDAEAAIKAASQNKQFAGELSNLVEIARPAVPVFQGLADVFQDVATALMLEARAMGIVTPGLDDLFRRFEVTRGANREYYNAIREGATVGEAEAKRQALLAEGLTQSERAQRRLTDAVNSDVVTAQKHADAYKEVNSQLNSLQSKNALTSLISQYTGVTEENVATALKQANAHRDLSDVVDTYTRRVENDITALNNAQQGTTQWTLAQQQLKSDSNALRDAIFALTTAKISDEIATQNAKDAEQAFRDAQRQGEDATRKSAQAREQATVAWRTYVEAVAKYGQDLLIKEQQNADESMRIQRTLNESRANADQTLGDRVSDINRSVRDKEFDEAWQLARDQAGIGHERVRQQNDVAQDILRIERSLRESLADLAFSTGLDVRKAQTEHEVAEIDLRYQHERSVKMRNADDQRTDKLSAVSLEEQEFAYKKKLVDEEATHRRDVGQRTTREQIDDARRTHREAYAAAQQRNKNEITDFNNKINIENMQLAQQASAIHQQWLDRTQDAIGYYTSEEKMLIHLAQIRAMQNPFAMSNDSASFYAGLNRAMQGGVGNYAQAQGYVLMRQQYNTAGRGLAGGGEGVVPPGFPNDSYPLWLTSGERFRVEPNGGSRGEPITNNTTTKTITINVTGNDPQDIAEQIRRVLNDEVLR